MFRLFLLFVLTFAGTCVRAQGPQTFTNDKGAVHLVGPLQETDLQKAPYEEWYVESAAETPFPEAIPDWVGQLTDVRVEIFLGTWCGDSRTWVPRFITLWQHLGLDPEQLHIVGLYPGGERYKQGPNGEEVGRKIHRVPTFIFERDGEELARIVERPRTDLVTDMAQIALGYPANARYQAANYLMDVLADNPVDSIMTHLQEYFRPVWRETSSLSELNTLGSVLKATGDADAALIPYRMNAAIYPHHPTIIRKYAEALLAIDELEAALERYEQVLDLDAEDELALAAVADLRTRLGKTEEGN